MADMQRLKLATIEAEKTWAQWRALPKTQSPETWATLGMTRLLELVLAVHPVIDPQAVVSQPLDPPTGETAEPR